MIGAAEMLVSISPVPAVLPYCSFCHSGKERAVVKQSGSLRSILAVFSP